MKQTIVIPMICATVAFLSSTGFSRSTQLQPNVQALTQCTLEIKNQYYKDFIANSAAVSDEAKALDAAIKYLACPGDPEDLADLNLAVGRMLRKNTSHEKAIPYFIKAASYESKIKTSAETYFHLAEAYEKGTFARLSAGYREKFAGKDETKESLLALENIYPIVDRMIDAYARSVALGGDGWRKLKPRAPGDTRESNGEYSQSECMEALTGWYEFRHDRSDAGLKELIESILSQPLPPEPTPITSLPPRKKSKH